MSFEHGPPVLLAWLLQQTFLSSGKKKIFFLNTIIIIPAKVLQGLPRWH